MEPGGGKQPMAIAPRSGEGMAFAGVWEGWRGEEGGEVVRTYAIVTTEANAPMRAVNDRMPVVRRHPESGERHLDLLRWGLLPRWAKDPKGARQPINARAETVATSPMFREAYAKRRCLVPADAFYE